MKRKRLLSRLAAVAALASGLTLSAQTIKTVTTANNANPPAGSTSLLQAMTGLQNGDTIRFNIPGNGPHVIATPAGGYPLITADNVTIDGYSQPGSTANTNPILAANNAKIGIVLDSRNGNVKVLDFDPEVSSSGYGDTEAAVIGIYGATNVTVSGVSILAVPLLPGASPGGDDVGVYGISWAKGASGHISGCWIGIHPDGTTVAAPADGITAFRYRVESTDPYTMSDNIIVGVKPGSTNATAEFNVFCGIPAIPIIIEAAGTRISGNFFNVFPSGDRDFNPPLVDPAFAGVFEGNIEIGRANNNTIIGVDGDGVNDANERNIFSGVLPESQGGYDHNIEFYGQTPGTNIIVAGNYFGVAVNGTTRFTNGVPALNAAGGSAQFRFGSDFDGVSDALEGNVVYNNWPTEMFPTTGAEGFFDELSTGAILSARGNSFINNFPFPVSPLRDAGGFLAGYYAKALVDPAAGVVPVLSTNTTLARLVGTVPVANAEYPVTIIDLYAADPEGIAYGQAAAVPELPNGYVQGKAYIGSFVDNSPADSNRTVGEFDFSLSGLEAKGSLLTVTANYSKSPAGTRNAIVLTSPFSDTVEVTFLPGSIEAEGLTRIEADTLINLPEADALGNWEPYASVLGNSHFLIEGNTFATNETLWQRYVVAVQPVDGSAAKTVEGFYADNGAAFGGRINGSRQNGNPGRVAGDKRPGALNYMVGGEASPHAVPEFQGDNRWTLGFDRIGTSPMDDDPAAGEGRYGVVQVFRLDPATLTPAPLSKALDSSNGRLTTGAAPDPQITRFGGDMAALDNGNFVSVVEDRSRVRNPDGNAVVATIFAPDGSVVKDSWVVANGDIWSNLAAYKGGFAVRASGTIYFHDNAGTLTGSVPQSSSGLSFDAGRGDGVRIGGHINSPFLFLLGKVTTENVVHLVVWDTRDRSFVTSAPVSEGAFSGGFDRANLAVDALNRVTGSWVSQPAGYEAQQVAARVMAFNDTTRLITPLTRSFLPFINAAQTGGIRTIQMSVAMTTREILVAAKGEINLQNQPAQGANSPREVNFYTVFTHPNPQADPTPPAGAGGQLTVEIEKAGPASLRLTWEGGSGPYLVQKKVTLADATWMNVLTTSETTALVPNDGTTAFFRVGSGATNTVIPLSAFMGAIFEKPNTNASTAMGIGTFSIEGDTFSYDIVYSGLTGPASAAHIHGFATTSESTGVQVGFTGLPTGTSGRIKGTATLTEAQRTNMLAGRTYANIHTTANGGGEIRGQVAQMNLRATLNGANERPNPVTTPATGTGKFTLVGNELFVDLSYTGLQGPINNSHIHGPGTAEQSVGVLVPMNGLHVGPFGTSTAGRFEGSVVLSPQNLSHIIDGLTYFNIHSVPNGGGEIRGQIVP